MISEKFDLFSILSMFKSGGSLRFDVQNPPDPSNPTLVPAPP